MKFYFLAFKKENILKIKITAIFFYEFAFFMKFYFLAFKKQNILKIKINAIFFYEFVLNIRLYDFRT